MLGALPGVVNTRTGWLEGKEVVEVVFDPKRTSYEKLAERARCVEKPSTAFVHDAKHLDVAKKIARGDAKLSESVAKDTKTSDRRYYLRRSPCWLLPLTDVQAVRINAVLGMKKGARMTTRDPKDLLSPSQQKLLVLVQEHWKAKRKVLGTLEPARSPAQFAAYEKRLRAVLAK